jgi:hypothetical protein
MRKKMADIFDMSCKMKWRITNAYIHDCRIANSAGRRILSVACAEGGERHGTVFRLCKPVQSWSFSYTCDAEYSLCLARGRRGRIFFDDGGDVRGNQRSVR